MSFRIAKLYSKLCFDEGIFVTHVKQLSNEEYENFRRISDKDVKSLKLSLQNLLTEKEYKVICLRFGLEGDEEMTQQSVGRLLNLSASRIGVIEGRALRKLRGRRSYLPIFFDASDEINKTYSQLKRELDEIHANPIFQKERELTEQLKKITKDPLRYRLVTTNKPGNESNNYPDSDESSDSMSIDGLGLSIRPYNCLRRAGIITISDILDRPADTWLEIREFGSKCAEELTEKMHKAGYVDFKICG